ncbi:MAG: hypothetical protein LBG59_02330 [Candidatus Peribacteria bacterium]|nr:hypothetical protein [Candidatus Peribacteria bacterium]
MLPTDFTDPEHPIIYGQQTPVQSLAICNFNNSMLVVGNEQYLWIYNPDEDTSTAQTSNL